MDREDDALDLTGRSIEAVAERISASGNHDPETVRETLAEISEEGTVTREAIDEALADLSKVVATPETRVEITRRTLTDASEAAEPVRDTEIVRSRLNNFETEISTLEERVTTLGSRLSALVERAQDPDDLHAIGSEIREIRSEATDVQGDADALTVEIESFEQYLRNPDRWADELGEDVDALEEAIEEPLEVAANVSDIERDGHERTDLALAWANATLQNRLQKLLIEDVKAELDALSEVAIDQGIDDPCNGIGQRLEEVETFRSDVSHRLDEVAKHSWERTHGEVINSFAQTLVEFEHPINWVELQDELEYHRERL
jgi:chromosome segregation ATPase